MAALFGLLATSVVAGAKIRVEVNGKPLQLKAAPMMRGGDVWVPLREITEALGGELKIIRPNELVGICLADKCVPLRIGSRDAVLVDGTAFAPAEKMAEALEVRMKWDKRKRLLGFFASRSLPKKRG